MSSPQPDSNPAPGGYGPAGYRPPGQSPQQSGPQRSGPQQSGPQPPPGPSGSYPGAPYPGVPYPGAPYPPGQFPPNPPAGQFPQNPTPGQFAPNPPPGQFPPNPPLAVSNASSQSLLALCRPLSVLVVALGLSIPFDSSNAWTTQLAWAIFAQCAATVAAAPVLVTGAGRSPATAWRVGAAGSVALAAHWLLVVLPSVGSNAGFVLTVGTALAAAATWFSPHRPRR
jgi:hypothetical protein